MQREREKTEETNWPHSERARFFVTTKKKLKLSVFSFLLSFANDFFNRFLHCLYWIPRYAVLLLLWPISTILWVVTELCMQRQYNPIKLKALVCSSFCTTQKYPLLNHWINNNNNNNRSHFDLLSAWARNNSRDTHNHNDQEMVKRTRAHANRRALFSPISNSIDVTCLFNRTLYTLFSLNKMCVVAMWPRAEMYAAYKIHCVYNNDELTREEVSWRAPEREREAFGRRWRRAAVNGEPYPLICVIFVSLFLTFSESFQMVCAN